MDALGEARGRGRQRAQERERDAAARTEVELAQSAAGCAALLMNERGVEPKHEPAPCLSAIAL